MCISPKKYGQLPLNISLRPAIRLAREGFPAVSAPARRDPRQAGHFQETPGRRRLFLKNGEVPPLGYVIRQPELARTLQLLADQGGDAVLSGGVRSQTRLASAQARRHLDASRTSRTIAPSSASRSSGTYHGARIVSASPPASGGIALVDALNILEAYDLGALDSATRKHVIVEAMRRVHRDRAIYLGDPDFVQIPVARLTHKFYADGQRTSLRLDRATPSEMLPSDAMSDAPRGTQTTHFSIIDREGNRVAATITLNTWFGTGSWFPARASCSTTRWTISPSSPARPTCIS